MNTRGKIIATLFVAIFMAILLFVGYLFQYTDWGLPITLIAMGIFLTATYFVIDRAAGASQTIEEIRQQRINKILSELDDADLDLLRERLMEDAGEEEKFESLTALLQHQKHKR